MGIHEYSDEAYTRKRLLDLFKLEGEKEQLQLFLLTVQLCIIYKFHNL